MNQSISGQVINNIKNIKVKMKKHQSSQEIQLNRSTIYKLCQHLITKFANPGLRKGKY